MQDSRKILMFDNYSEYEIQHYILSTWFAWIKTTELSHYFLWCFILSDEFDTMKNNIANWAVQIAANNKNLEKIDFIVPDDKTLIKFNEWVKSLFTKIYYNNKEIESLSSTRDQLLPKLMSWEVRVEF
jgi:type I restriction enzyme S subunit